MDNELNLCKELYDKKSLMKAVAAFAGIAIIKQKEYKDYWQCIFLDSKAGIDRTKHEFENYLISLVNQKER